MLGCCTADVYCTSFRAEYRTEKINHTSFRAVYRTENINHTSFRAVYWDTSSNTYCPVIHVTKILCMVIYITHLSGPYIVQAVYLGHLSGWYIVEKICTAHVHQRCVVRTTHIMKFASDNRQLHRSNYPVVHSIPHGSTANVLISTRDATQTIQTMNTGLRN